MTGADILLEGLIAGPLARFSGLDLRPAGKGLQQVRIGGRGLFGRLNFGFCHHCASLADWNENEYIRPQLGRAPACSGLDLRVFVLSRRNPRTVGGLLLARTGTLACELASKLALRRPRYRRPANLESAEALPH
jgi:hypothetical protein